MVLVTAIVAIALQQGAAVHGPGLAFKNVRSPESGIRDVIADGYERSSTFRELVDTVEDLDCVAYVTSIVKLSQNMRAALLHSVAGKRNIPVLRVLLKTNLGRDEAIAIIGHELQHVIEAVTNAATADNLNLARTFEKLDRTGLSTGIHRYDTDAAIAVTSKIRNELKRAGGQRVRKRVLHTWRSDQAPASISIRSKVFSAHQP
jgi:hypothetical protein